jgi:hypothetical protein
MAIELTHRQARRMLLAAQALLAPRRGGPAAAVHAIRRACGLQAQDIFAGTLGVRSRTAGAVLADVEQARFEARSVVWTWAMRGTLHLVAADDLDWLLAAVGPPMIAAAKSRRAELGLDETTYRQALRVVRDHLLAYGPATRDELGGSLASAGLPSGYSAERILLHRAALEGRVCMGPDRGHIPTFVLLEDWLGRPLEARDAEGALAALAARYLAAYAPASLHDFATWSGLPMKALRPAWDIATTSAVEVSIDRRPAWASPDALDVLAGLELAPQPVHLLPPFDTYLLGHRDRRLVADARYEATVKGGGMLRAVVLVDGFVAGTWRPNRQGKRVAIEVQAFETLPADAQAGVDDERADIERFLAG